MGRGRATSVFGCELANADGLFVVLVLSVMTAAGLVSAPAHAAEVPPESQRQPFGPQDEMKAPPPTSERRDEKPRPRVRIVSIGRSISQRELLAVLGTDFVPGAEVTSVSAEHFDPRKFLRLPRNGDVDFEVWVDASDPRYVQLYFVDRSTSRYAHRTLELSGAMDEMDLEALAQAITWSLRALRSGSVDTLSRTEVRSVLQRKSEAEQNETGEQVVDETTAPRPAQTERLSPAVQVEAFYRGMLHSRAFGVMHGPGLGLGVSGFGERLQASFRASGQLQVPATLQDPRVALTLTAAAWRFETDVLAQVTERWWIGVRGALGVDSIWSQSNSGDDSVFSARPTSVHHAPLVAVSLLSRLHVLRHLQLVAGLGVETDFTRIDYQLQTSQGPEPFVTRHRVRPTLILGVQLP